MVLRAIITIAAAIAVSGLPPPARAQDAAPPAAASEHRLSFRSHDGLIYIPASVNGSRATLLIDTGAVFTMFTLKAVPFLNDDSKITIRMAKGSVTASRRPVGFTLGNPERQEHLCAFHQDAVVGDFQFREADGVVGLDVLGRFKSITFDFKNSVLILKDR